MRLPNESSTNASGHPHRRRIWGDKPPIRIQFEKTETVKREYSYQIPGGPSRSTTNCNANATGTGGGPVATASGQSNCTTQTTPGTPTTTSRKIATQVHVRVLLPDGRRFTVSCQRGFRRCEQLEPASYDASLDGDSVWIFTHDMSGKEYGIKFKRGGTWQD